jgi:hypothetical protein
MLTAELFKSTSWIRIKVSPSFSADRTVLIVACLIQFFTFLGNRRMIQISERNLASTRVSSEIALMNVEHAIRPVLVLGKTDTGGAYFIENAGPGVALNVVWLCLKNEDELFANLPSMNIIPPHQKSAMTA